MTDKNMTVDYRVRCVVANCAHDRIYYGIRAKDYNAGWPEAGAAVDLPCDFDHSKGRGRVSQHGRSSRGR